MASGHSRDISRLNAFTDGVMVVSMTLLVLDVRFPDGVAGLDGAALFHALAELWPKFFGYVLSFVVIAKYWMGYTDTFGEMKSMDSGFAWLNIAFLLTVGFIPFVTTLLSANNGRVATSLYALTMVAISLLLCVMWLYAARNGLVASDGHYWREIAPMFQIAVVFGASIVVAQFHPTVAQLTWLLLAAPLPRSLAGNLPKTS